MISLLIRRARSSSGICQTLIVTLWLGLMSGGQAHAFEELNEAQNLIYGTGHLANTRLEQRIAYQYTNNDTAADAVTDSVTLSVLAEGEEGRRDVELAFLTGERHLSMPPFNGYRGNPVIIAMLEHVAQAMGAQTGGGVLYFRNRIRDALAGDDVSVVSATASYQGRDIATKTITFRPLVGDSYLQEHPLFLDSTFTLVLSEEVPAGVYRIDVRAVKDDQRFERSLILE